MNRTNSKIKAAAATIITLLCLTATTAYADFRKALDAYIARDGETLLKEVKDAVDKKNDDGLILFLNAMRIDEITSNKKSLNEDFSADAKKKQTTLESILNSSQQSELTKQLETAVCSAPVNTRYIYYSRKISKPTSQSKSQNISISELESLANNGSVDAAIDLIQSYGIGDIGRHEMARLWFIRSAELGDAYSSASLAFNYLGYSPKYFLSPTSCEQLKINGVCFEKDLEKGSFWLKEAVKNIDRNPLYMRRFALNMGIMLSSNNAREVNYLQAYLWFLLALNSPDVSGFGVSTERILNQVKLMHENHQLALVAPELESAWNDTVKRNELLFPRKLASFPDLLLEVRRQEKLNAEPVFSYLHMADNLPYKLDVLKNGDVKLGFFMQNNMSSYTHTSALNVKKFLIELDKLLVSNRYLSWSSRTASSYGCNVCKGNDNMFTIYTPEGKTTYYIGYDRNDELDKKINNKIAELSALVEKYFPTAKLRCSIGNSKTYNDECHARNVNLIMITN